MAGDTSLDVLHHKTALVKNPVWIRPGHRNWETAGNFVLKGNTITAFDRKNERLFIAGSDSIVIFDLQNFREPWTRLAVDHENILRGSQGIYDTLKDKLYNIFIALQEDHLGFPEWGLFCDPDSYRDWPGKSIGKISMSF